MQMSSTLAFFFCFSCIPYLFLMARTLRKCRSYLSLWELSKSTPTIFCSYQYLFRVTSLVAFFAAESAFLRRLFTETSLSFWHSPFA